MKLTFQERANLGAVLPKEGDWFTLTVVRELQKAIMPTDEDIKAVDGVVNEDGSLNFNLLKDTEKEFPITGMQYKVTKDRLTKLEGEKKLPIAFMSLYEKFVVEEKPEFADKK